MGGDRFLREIRIAAGRSHPNILALKTDYVYLTGTGNPTKSYRSRDPLRVTGDVTDWQGHSPEAIKAMDGIRGLEPVDD